MRLYKWLILFLCIDFVAINAATAQSHTGVGERFSKNVSDTLYLYFKVGKSNIIPSFMDNEKILASFDKIIEDKASPRFSFNLQGITLQGSASPEGKVRWNMILAKRRADALVRYIMEKYSVNENLIKKDDIALNLGASYSKWPVLRSARVIVDYSKVSKDELIPKVAQARGCKLTGEVTAAEPLHNFDGIYENLSGQTVEKKKSGFLIALKTNLLYDLVLTPNIGLEIPLHKNWSVAANWMYAWWKSDPKSWYHRIYGGDVEIRRWIKPQSPLTGWHVGAYGQMVTYDFELGGNGILGDKWSWAAGISAGYSKKIAKRLNLDFTLGVGYLTGKYYEYKPVDDCYVWQATKNRIWLGPTKAEVSLVWLLGR